MSNKRNDNSSLKSKLPWIMSLVFGALSILAVNKFLTIEKTKTDFKKVYAIVAAKDLEQGQVLTLEDLTLAQFAADSMSNISITVPGTNNSVNTEETNNKMQILIGQKIRRNITKNDQVFWSDLAQTHIEKLPEYIPVDMAAVSIPVNNISSLNYLIEVGSIVDIIYTGDNSLNDELEFMQLLAGRSPYLENQYKTTALVEISDDSESEDVQEQRKVKGSLILLSSVKIIATGSEYHKDDRNQDSNLSSYSTVTLLVTPEEGLLITQAMNNGELSLMLRSQAKKFEHVPTEITSENLIKESKRLNEVRNNSINK